MTHSGKWRAGSGGWTYEPWRGTFYPPGLPHARELEPAASRVSAIEINGTYYRLQKPDSFARLAEAVPPGFVFTIKSTRFCTNRKILATAVESIQHFLGQGQTEIGEKIGLLLWHFILPKAFDPNDF